MTTEVGSETDVKKEPEKVPEAQHQTDPVQTDQPDKPADSDAQPVASAAQPEESRSAEPESPQEESSSPDPSSPPATGGQKKEKGISRFLPPWLKRQKSQSQDQASESAEQPQSLSPKEEEEESEPKAQPDGAGAAPNTEKTEEEKEEKQESRPEEVQLEENEKEEEKSVGSADTQPVREEKEAESEVKERKEEKKEEEQVIQQETSVLSPLRLNKKMKMVVCHVTLLDGSQFSCEVEKRAKGQYLFFEVCEHLNLIEKDYFGLSFKDNAEQRCWLDPTKEIKRQIRNSQWQFAFSVKFYPPDPSQLTEDITRYLLCLQLRQDIASGRLPCSFVTHALLGSYSLQAELGDYDPEEHRLDYISDLQFAPNQTKELEEKVVELHKSHRGMTPAQADAQFLENAKKLSMYGVDLHHAKDSEGVDIMLGVCANGLLIYKDRLRINRFAWPKILKISYKRSNFYIKIRPGEAEQFESTVGFKLPNHRAAKRVWKVCVEHHTFFRLMSPENPTKSKFLTLGSKFRYSGRTQAQTRQASSLIDRPAPYFQRTSSKRISRSLDGAPMVNVSDYSHAVDSALTAGAGENGPALDLNSDSKSPQVEVVEKPDTDVATSVTYESAIEQTDKGGTGAPERKDLDKTQEDVLKHQASISELKRSFMEATPEPRPSQWDKRLTGSPATTLRLQAQGSLEEELTSLFLSKACFSGLAGSCSTTAAPAEVPQKSPPHPESDSRDASKSTEVKPEVNGQPEFIEVVEETVVIEEVIKAKPRSPAPETPVTVETEVKEDRSLSSDSESEEEEAEYHAQTPSASISVQQIEEEPEEEQELIQQAPPSVVELQPITEAEPADSAPSAEEEQATAQPEEEECTDKDDAPNGHAPAAEAPPPLRAVEEEPPVVNGSVSRVEAELLPQVICCSEPPVVKTEMVTISDTFAAQKTEISTKEVPIVHTETKTITYEAAQLDGNGDGEPGVLMTAQTITSESLCTTTTTHITKTLKGGLSETRIEKRIVITGDSDIDHDQALAQAIKEAKEQHPDMSVTRVVVHKETELAEDED
ncbi:band 4.1-like protein 2 isoform X3 [Rhinichthys klamathensis goyatoka]|uniref:band 4.1-like protein 2 isoform X3 n=1 Tax=Rhinichthys klamathensis goyatoka TaxID=3034132 RepID=UPI0024B536F3|nr:band 4.1-like protein 2 isoform X3 [Rhinichthys klamathensis goyatoka]